MSGAAARAYGPLRAENCLDVDARAAVERSNDPQRPTQSRDQRTYMF